MEIIKAHLKNGQYKDLETKKNIITLHHTSGTSAEGALEWWDQTPARVGCAYVIDHDGKIYEAFEPKYWAWHINIPNDNDYFEKANIGIELVNPGGLFLVKDKYVFYPLYPNLTHPKYFNQNEVVGIPGGYRDYKFFHIYTQEELESLEWLLYKLIKDFRIPLQEERLLNNFWEWNEEVIIKGLSGIWSHSTFRKDKSDIFPYQPLIDTVNRVYKMVTQEVEIKPSYEEVVEPTSVKVDKAPKKTIKKK